jgi:hypothetical protein
VMIVVSLRFTGGGDRTRRSECEVATYF